MYKGYFPFISIRKGEEKPRAEDDFEEIFVMLMMDHPLQGRKELNVDRALHLAAMHKAKRISDLCLFSHVIDNTGPNTLAKNFGYDLPDWYSSGITANNIESISRGHPSTLSSFNALVKSESHRPHILGLGNFFANQTKIGVGYCHNPDNLGGWNDVWCIITAH